MGKEAVLLIFVKNPVAGHVKTRLARSIGPAKALKVYEKLLAYTRRVTKPLHADKQVWYSQHVEAEDGWYSDTYDKKLQRGSDLGARMKNAFEEVFSQGYEKVIIIGSDCAEITTELIEQAFQALSQHDVVVGPSADGGYYLLGMNAFHPDLFRDIDWSTPRVLSQTLARVEQKKLAWHLLPELNDVDNKEDWNQVKERF